MQKKAVAAHPKPSSNQEWLPRKSRHLMEDYNHSCFKKGYNYPLVQSSSSCSDWYAQKDAAQVWLLILSESLVNILEWHASGHEKVAPATCHAENEIALVLSSGCWDLRVANDNTSDQNPGQNDSL